MVTGNRWSLAAADAIEAGPVSTPDPVLLADQHRPEDVVDAAVEDDDVVAADGLAVDDARDVGAGRADEEAAGLEQDAGVARGGVGGHAGRQCLEPLAELAEVQRGLVRRVRDAEAAAGVDQRAARSPLRPPVRGPRPPSPRRARRATAASSTFDAPNACSPSGSSQGEATASAAADRRSAPSMPNLPAPSSPTRRTRSRRAASDTAARSRIGWRRPRPSAIRARRRSSPGDSTVTTRTPASTAAASSSSRLPGPVNTTCPASKPARRTCRSSPPDATSAPRPSPRRCREDRQVRVRLDRVREVEGGGQRLPGARPPAA